MSSPVLAVICIRKTARERNLRAFGCVPHLDVRMAEAPVDDINGKRGFVTEMNDFYGMTAVESFRIGALTRFVGGKKSVNSSLIKNDEVVRVLFDDGGRAIGWRPPRIGRSGAPLGWGAWHRRLTRTRHRAGGTFVAPEVGALRFKPAGHVHRFCRRSSARKVFVFGCSVRDGWSRAIYFRGGEVGGRWARRH